MLKLSSSALKPSQQASWVSLASPRLASLAGPLGSTDRPRKMEFRQASRVSVARGRQTPALGPYRDGESPLLRKKFRAPTARQPFEFAEEREPPKPYGRAPARKVTNWPHPRVQSHTFRSSWHSVVFVA